MLRMNLFEPQDKEIIKANVVLVLDRAIEQLDKDSGRDTAYELKRKVAYGEFDNGDIKDNLSRYIEYSLKDCETLNPSRVVLQEIRRMLHLGAFDSREDMEKYKDNINRLSRKGLSFTEVNEELDRIAGIR